MRKELRAVHRFYVLISQKFAKRGYLLFFMLFFSSALLLPFPFLTKFLFDNIILNPDKSAGLHDLVIIAALFFFLQVLDSTFLYFLEVYRTKFDNDLSIYLRNLLTEKLSKAKESFFQKTDYGTIFHRYTDDVEQSQSVLFDGVSFAVIDSAKLIFGILAMLYLSVPLAFMALVLLPFYVWAVQSTTQTMEKRQDQVVKRRGSMYDVFFEYIRNIHLVKTYVVNRFAEARIQRKMSDYSDDLLNYARSKSLLEQAAEFISSIGPLVVLVYGCELIIEGQLTVGALVAFIEFVPYAFDSANGLVTFNVDLTTAYPSMKNLFDVLDYSEENQPGETFSPLASHDIVFQDVTAVMGRKTILRDVSFEVPQFSTVAVVGSSGAGKSSILRLIEGFWYPHKGFVLVGGADTHTADIRSIRSDIGYVSQETALLKGTVLDNITLGKNMDFEKVHRCAQIAQIDDLIQSLPKRYRTVVDPEESRLSGGQMQRLSLARALAQDKKILLLDEFSSELDPVTEHKILQGLRKFHGEKTMVIVTHNERCLKGADLILVVEKGRLAEQGTHASLSRNRQSAFHRVFDFRKKIKTE